MSHHGTDHLFLDARGLGAEVLLTRFPTIVATCRRHGIDPVADPIPVAPAAHYASGGVRTDARGRVASPQGPIPGLYACGEVACTGVHGANRLASNSCWKGSSSRPASGKRSRARCRSGASPPNPRVGAACCLQARCAT